VKAAVRAPASGGVAAAIENMRERENLLGLSVLRYIGGVTEYNKITIGLPYTTDLPIHVGSYLHISNNRRIYHII
jgi:hypothetical protein